MAYEFATQCIHAGQPNEAVTGAVTYPIFQTSTFAEEEPGVHRGFCYSRTNNPTRQALEENIAALEGARHGIAFASGLAAVNDVLNLLRAGDHVIAGRDLYGGSYRLFTKLYAKFGVTFSFVDTTDIAEIERHIHGSTKLLWLESPSNPLLAITDVAAASELARERGIVTVVDNTFATPVLQRPLELGADIVLHSTTKYLNGHADVIGGCVVTSDDELAKELRYYQNTVGAVPGPQDCFLVLRGTKTLPLRVERHCENARAIAGFLDGHEAIARVHFPGLATHPGHELAKRQMKDFGAVISFELKGGFEAARTFATSTKLFTLAESLGAVKSLLCHPATMTHASVEPEVRLARGITDGLIRLSVGIEDKRDLIADLELALELAAAATPKAEEVAA